jgi:hypothetical protein
MRESIHGDDPIVALFDFGFALASGKPAMRFFEVWKSIVWMALREGSAEGGVGEGDNGRAFGAFELEECLAGELNFGQREFDVAKAGFADGNAFFDFLDLAINVVAVGEYDMILL